MAGSERLKEMKIGPVADGPGDERGDGDYAKEQGGGDLDSEGRPGQGLPLPDEVADGVSHEAQAEGGGQERAVRADDHGQG